MYKIQRGAYGMLPAVFLVTIPLFCYKYPKTARIYY